jgi:predicted DNA-binding protein (UPF0251 family)
MSRPIKSRHVNILPSATYFKPRGIPLAFLEEVTLTIDECEALRLADLKAYSHEKAAAKMKISRATFGRVIEKARFNVVDAIVNGKAILIEGGNFRIGNNFHIKCQKCNRSWECLSGSDIRGKCPKCKKSKQRKD